VRFKLIPPLFMNLLQTLKYIMNAAFMRVFHIIGVAYKSYYAVITRTIFVSEEHKRVYNVVLKA
jgi:hypothetical protein